MTLAYAFIHEENGVFGISFPDFPGCVSTGVSAENVISKGSAALSFHVSGMLEDAEALPVLRTLAELQADASFKDDSEGAVLALVPFEIPGRAVRINMSIDENLLQAVDRSASASGQSRSAFLAEAARSRLRGAP